MATDQQRTRIKTLVERHVSGDAAEVETNVLLEICEIVHRGCGGEFMLSCKDPLKHGSATQQRRTLQLVEAVTQNTPNAFLVELSTPAWTERFFRICKTTTAADVRDKVISLCIVWAQSTIGMRQLCERFEQSKVLGEIYGQIKKMFDEQAKNVRRGTPPAGVLSPSPSRANHVDPNTRTGGSPGGEHHAREALLNVETMILEVQGDLAALEYGIQNPDVLDAGIVKDCASHHRKIDLTLSNTPNLDLEVKTMLMGALEQLTNLLSFHDAIFGTSYVGEGGASTPREAAEAAGLGGGSGLGASVNAGASPGGAAAAAPMVSGIDAADKARWEAKTQELEGDLAKTRKQLEDLQAKYKDAKSKNKLAIETIEETAAAQAAAEERCAELEAAAKKGADAPPKVVEKVVKVKPTIDPKIMKTMKKAIGDLRGGLKDLRAVGTDIKVETSRFSADIAGGVQKVAVSASANEADKKRIKMLEELYKREMKLRKQYYNQIQELKGNIRVYCRIRPLSGTETKNGHTDITGYPTVDEITIVDDRGRTKGYEFDTIFQPDSTQEQVFEDTKPLIDSVVDGYNVCIFAYGQTGSGKTHTMTGYPGQPGINGRALNRLFEVIKERSTDEESTVEASVLEIYNENIRDLLVSKAEAAKKSCDVRTGGKYGHYVSNLTEVPVTNPSDIESIMETAGSNRSQTATNMNEHSSRSHMIVYIIVKTRNKHNKAESYGKLSLVDLAGSERLAKSGAEGQAAKEAVAINKSLTALGDTIAALSQSAKHVPYRNSTLTHLLQDSMAGQAKVLMFCCASPASYNSQETQSSLGFASRARGVSLGQAKKNVS